MKYISEEQLRVLEKEFIDCTNVEDMMCDYADNDLTESLKDRIDDHISSCKKCRHFKDSYLQTIEYARLLKPRVEPVKPPLELTTDAKNRLRAALNHRLGINLPVVS